MPRLHLTNHLTRLLSRLLSTLPEPVTTLLPLPLPLRTRTRTRARSRALSRPPIYPYAATTTHYKDKDLLPPRPQRRHLLTRRALTMAGVALLVLLSGLVLLPAYAIYRPPHLLIRYFQHRWPDTTFHVPLPPAAPPTIALTIDDAPSTFTPQILELLTAHEARATFFVIGAQIPGAGVGPAATNGEAMLRELVRHGMELANHAMSDRPSRDLSDAVLEAEVRGVQGWLERVEDQVASASASASASGERGAGEGGAQGKAPAKYKYKWFRPGSGFFSDRMRVLIHRLGLRMALGSVYPHDAQINWPRVNAWHILSMVRSGSVIVCHDRRGWTVPMLKRVLPELKRRGFRVVTLSELVELGEQSQLPKQIST
ncbi:glycoside hydrolase/deacetylase [Aspergillus indologenus CBS 114.80]|uniref:chitin deacetylase n=1 Tax=Aspergillus indologenus CBS 114.80 TaxID=1450541 RepID=A0A2V5HZR5_9EURO|nr:glycoside hydrolase/deacetylase [Aspergillus indologenus CBS 114.80]